MTRDRRTGAIGVANYTQLTQLIEEGHTANQLADLLHVNPETIRKFARKRGLKIHRQDTKGVNHPCWKGGTTVDRSGYILRRVERKGKYGYLIRALARRGKKGLDDRGYAPVHRIVMHDLLGRRLMPGEVVDHIDGDIQNNAPSNLRLFASNAEHLKVTLKGRVPNWTPEGKARMTGRPTKKRQSNPPAVNL